MMHDRFDAQLRAHLVANANERPADGQLAAIVERVAVTPQRPSLVARLTWLPGRVGPVPSTVLRFGLVALALAMATLAGAIVAGGARTPSTPFEGTWTTIDPVDRSGMTLVIGPGTTPSVYFEDGYASGEACINDAVKRFTARGTGVITGDLLQVTFPDGGGCGTVTVEVDGELTYDPETDTIEGIDGIVWRRPFADAPPSTPGPASPEPTATLEPVTFDSMIHAYNIDYPATWDVRPATVPWAGDVPPFDSPEADVLSDPGQAGLYVVIAAQPYDGRTPDEWREAQLSQLCTDGIAFGSWTVDGFDAWVVGCDGRDAVLVFTETRGYLIRLVVLSDDPTVQAAYGWDWLKVMLATADLKPEDLLDAPTPASSPAPEATAPPVIPPSPEA